MNYPYPTIKFIPLIFICWCCSVEAQETKQDSMQVANTVDELYLAMVQKDQSVLYDFTADRLSYGHSSGTIENRQQFIDQVLTGEFVFLIIDTEDQEIEIDGDVALVRHILLIKGMAKNEPADVRIGNLMVFKKKDSSWKLLARQAYKLP